MSDILEKIKEMMPPWRKRYIKISMDIASQIATYLKEANMTQQDLAIALGKHKSEVSKYLSGNHNFTLQTIAKIEEVFQKSIVLVPKFLKEDMDVKTLKPEIPSSSKDFKTSGGSFAKAS